MILDSMASYTPPDTTMADPMTHAGQPFTNAPQVQHLQGVQQQQQQHVQQQQVQAPPPALGRFVRTRSMNISFESTPGQLAGQTNSAVWRLADSNTNLFFWGVKGFGDTSLEGRRADVSQMRIHEIVAMKTFSTAKVPVSLDITALKGNTYSKTGKRSAMTVFPGVNTTPEVLLEKSVVLDSSFTESYPNYTAGNLRSLGISQVPGDTSFMVTQKHPIIGVLRTNPNILQGSEDSIHPSQLHHGCFTLSEATTEHVLTMVEKAIISRLPDNDCSDFKATLSRSDGQPFATQAEIAEVKRLGKEDAVAASTLPAATPLRVDVLLQITFEPI